MAHPYAEGVVERVGDGGDRRAHGALASAERWVLIFYYVNLDRRRPRESQDRIVLPRRRAGPPGFLQRPARRLHAAAFDLVRDAVGIDRQADVHRRHEPRDAQLGAACFNLGHDGAVGTDVLVARVGETSALTFPSFPSRPVRFSYDFLNDRTSSWILEMAQAEFHRVGLRRGGELVHEGLDAEDVAEGTERAQRG